jgi:hypothetical protein
MCGHAAHPGTSVTSPVAALASGAGSSMGCTVLASPAEYLIAHLGLTGRTTAEVQDLYSRPIAAPAVPLRQTSQGSKRLSRPVIGEPERSAA